MALLLFVAGAQPVSNPPGTPEVRWFGALREILHEGRLGGRAPIAAALQRPHAYALGALAALDGEFVVLDGVVHLSRPARGGGLTNARSSSGRDSAALMVFAHVPGWRSFPLRRAIPVAALADTVLARAAALGLPAEGPLPFLIEGPMANLAWHVADGRKLPAGPSTHEAHAAASVHGTRATVRGTLLGFASRRHKGDFMHRDSDTHLHVWLPADSLSAHVDDVVVSPGAILKLPRAR
jgi:hypothetical protein